MPLELPVLLEERVEDLRPRIAKALGVAPRQIVIFHGDGELLDGQSLRDLITSDEALALSIQKLPCQLRPHEYQQQIDHETSGFKEVCKIQYPTWHDLDFPEWATHHDRYCRTDELAIPAPWDGFDSIGRATFPAPQDININMMPFIMGKEDSLPEAYRHYWPLIEQCNVPKKENGKICYLTIQESQVAAGQCQRRSGAHIESPGTIKQGGEYREQRYNWGCGAIIHDGSQVEGGIYMASNISNTCRIWDVKIKDPAIAVDNFGGVEHMRDLLGDGVCMEANKIYWLTDATPHESLPLETDGYRQFFRLVTSSLSVWYPGHSTANELVEIDKEVTELVDGSKFLAANDKSSNE